LTLHQPSVGFISLSPSAVSDSSYYSYTKITASLSLPSGYRNNGWTGALSGTGLSKSFTMTKDTMLGVDVQPLAAGTRKIFSSASAFKSAVLGASPGDTIELTDGIYNIGNCSPDSAVLIGIPTMPIVIRAQNRGKVELNGSSAFDFKFAEYTTVEGFVFTGNPGTVIRTECCNNIRITRNVFRLSETTSGKWILIGGRYNIARALSHHNRVDYNLFEEKHQLGNYVTIDGSLTDSDRRRRRSTTVLIIIILGILAPAQPMKWSRYGSDKARLRIQAAIRSWKIICLKNATVTRKLYR